MTLQISAALVTDERIPGFVWVEWLASASSIKGRSVLFGFHSVLIKVLCWLICKGFFD